MKFLSLLESYANTMQIIPTDERKEAFENFTKMGFMLFSVGEKIPIEEFEKEAQRQIDSGMNRDEVYASMYEVLFQTSFGAFCAAVDKLRDSEETSDLISSMEDVAATKN